MQNSFSTYVKRGSLVKQIRTRLFLSMGLLFVILIIHLSGGFVISAQQHNMITNSLTLRDDINELQNAMVNQETGIRGYIATANAAFLEPFTTGHETYLATLDQLHELLDSNNFMNTQVALPEMEAQADAWYQNYAQIQLANMQNGYRKIALEEGTIQQGKELFDHYRLQANHLDDASRLDVEQQQHWMDTLNAISTAISLLLATPCSCAPVAHVYTLRCDTLAISLLSLKTPLPV